MIIYDVVDYCKSLNDRFVNVAKNVELPQNVVFADTFLCNDEDEFEDFVSLLKEDLLLKNKHVPYVSGKTPHVHLHTI
jgi:hypothetical protein